MENNVLTCVYCGHQYPDGTPAAKHELLTEHIKVCESHPMREAENKISILKDALVGLIGTDDLKELNEMEAIVRASMIPQSDLVATVNAIDALRLTIGGK